MEEGGREERWEGERWKVEEGGRGGGEMEGEGYNHNRGRGRGGKTRIIGARFWLHGGVRVHLLSCTSTLVLSVPSATLILSSPKVRVCC